MRSLSFALPAALVVALAACSSGPSKPVPAATGQSSTPPSATLAPPDSSTRAVSSGSGDLQSGWVSTYPYGSSDDSTSGAVPAAGASDSQPAAAPPGGWSKTDASPEQRQADVEACYNYAWSQVDRDIRIDSDRDAARYDEDSGLGFTALTKRMDHYEHGQRRTELINDCMEDKGYSRG